MGRKHYDPTEAELEATIAEQMKNLPKWWHKETTAAKQKSILNPKKGKPHDRRSKTTAKR